MSYIARANFKFKHVLHKVGGVLPEKDKDGKPVASEKEIADLLKAGLIIHQKDADAQDLLAVEKKVEAAKKELLDLQGKLGMLKEKSAAKEPKAAAKS